MSRYAGACAHGHFPHVVYARFDTLFHCLIFTYYLGPISSRPVASLLVLIVLARGVSTFTYL